MHPTPDKPGTYWAKWKIADPDTPPDMLTHGSPWEAVQVFDNGGDGSEPFRVAVPGVEQSQSLDGFYWGPRIEPPT